MDIRYVGKSNKQLIKKGQDVDGPYTSRLITNVKSWLSILKKKRENARARNENYRLIGNGSWPIFIYFNCHLVIASVYANVVL